LIGKDLYSGFKDAYPMATKSADDTSLALRMFMGRRDVSKLRATMRCDNSGELQKACKMLGICRDSIQPGVPQTNTVAERTVQDITNGTSAALSQAGLPPCFWPIAVQTYCVLDNTNFQNGESAWFKTHGKEFPGEHFPLGCKVVFKLSSTQNNEMAKDDPKTLVGVFAGYVMKKVIIGLAITWFGLWSIS
jgi:hypothetical protein